MQFLGLGPDKRYAKASIPGELLKELTTCNWQFFGFFVFLFEFFLRRIFRGSVLRPSPEDDNNYLFSKRIHNLKRRLLQCENFKRIRGTLTMCFGMD